MDTTSDHEALGRAGSDPAAFALVYERHGDAVLRYLARRIGPELAEDLTAEVFLRALRAQDAYAPVHDTCRPWLFGIAQNLLADHRRTEARRRKQLTQLTRELVHEPERNPEVAGRDEVFAALYGLKAADRETFLLIVLGELSYDETAATLGVPVGTVRSRVARARRHLQTSLSGESTQQPTRISEPGEAHA